MRLNCKLLRWKREEDEWNITRIARIIWESFILEFDVNVTDLLSLNLKVLYFPSQTDKTAAYLSCWKKTRSGQVNVAIPSNLNGSCIQINWGPTYAWVQPNGHVGVKYWNCLDLTEPGGTEYLHKSRQNPQPKRVQFRDTFYSGRFNKTLNVEACNVWHCACVADYMHLVTKPRLSTKCQCQLIGNAILSHGGQLEKKEAAKTHHKANPNYISDKLLLADFVGHVAIEIAT